MFYVLEQIVLFKKKMGKDLNTTVPELLSTVRC